MDDVNQKSNTDTTARPVKPGDPATMFNTVEDAVHAIAAGEMIIVVDDADRENEGDLVMSASRATSEQIAFIIRHTSGIVCVPVTHDDARRLHLSSMVSDNDAPLQTAFTVSVDYRAGLTTGISADERTATLRALANDNVGAEDFVRPGHVFPLVAKKGGVLTRSGHTEAAVDLATLAGDPPVGVLAELVNDDGTVKRLPQLLQFAEEHGLKIVSIYRGHHRLSAAARAAGRAGSGVRRRHRDRHGQGGRLLDAVRRSPAPRARLRRHQ